MTPSKLWVYSPLSKSSRSLIVKEVFKKIKEKFIIKYK